MPNYRLNRFGMRSDHLDVYGGHDYAYVGHFCRIPSIAAHYSCYGGAHFARELHCAYQVRADVALHVSPTDREDKDHVRRLKPAAAEPTLKHRVPSFVVGTRCQLGNVICRRIAFNICELAEIIYCVATVTCA